MTKQIEQPQTCENTDTKLWSEPPKDYYSSSIHVTKNNKIGIDVGGNVFVKSLSEWHNLASKALAETQEPVAIHQCYMEADNWIDCSKEYYDGHPEWAHKRIVYTTPQSREWVGLSEDELEQAFVRNLSDYEFGRAIEAKLREKNG